MASALATGSFQKGFRFKRYIISMIEVDTAAELVTDLSRLPLHGRGFRKAAMNLLDQLEGWDWSGIYRMENGELVLDEFTGAPTEHVRIPVGVGICGTAVAEDRNVIVDDVTKVDNYLACSTETRSELVVLIRKGGEILGQIDIDSHQPGRFDATDEAFLGELAELIADRWEEKSAASV